MSTNHESSPLSQALAAAEARRAQQLAASGPVAKPEPAQQVGPAQDPAAGNAEPFFAFEPDTTPAQVPVPLSRPERLRADSSGNAKLWAKRTGAVALALVVVGVFADKVVGLQHSWSSKDTPAATGDQLAGKHHKHHKHIHARTHDTTGSVTSMPPSMAPSHHAKPHELSPIVLPATTPSPNTTAAPTESPTASPTKGNSSSGAGAETFKIATENVHGAIHTAAKGPQSGTERAKAQAELIQELDLAVVGQQELEAPQRTEEMKDLGPDYGIYPKRPQYGIHNKHVNSVNSIIWNKTKVKFLSASSLPMRYFHGWKFKVPVVEFMLRSTGQIFKVANTHDPAKKQWAEYRYFDQLRHAKDARSIIDAETPEVPLFFTGDFNGPDSLDARHNTVWQHKKSHLVVNIMRKYAGLADAFLATHPPKNGVSSLDQATKVLGVGGDSIDHIFSKKKFIDSFHIIRNHARTASDHALTYIVARLTGVAVKKR